MRNVVAFLLCLVEGVFSWLAFSIGDERFKEWHIDCTVESLEEVLRFSNKLNLKWRHKEVRKRWQRLKSD